MGEVKGFHWNVIHIKFTN